MVDGTVDAGDQERQIKQYVEDTSRFAGTVVTIEDDVTDGAWAEFFADVNEKRKEIESWFDSVKKPLNASLKNLNAKQHELCDPLKAVEDAITKARGNWLRIKQARIKLENEEAIKNSAENEGGVALINREPPKTVVTGSGASVGLRNQPSWRLTDDPELTAKEIEKGKIKFDRSDPRLKNVPDCAFILQPGLIMPLIKTGQMPVGPHSIEKFDDLASTTR